MQIWLGFKRFQMSQASYHLCPAALRISHVFMTSYESLSVQCPRQEKGVRLSHPKHREAKL